MVNVQRPRHAQEIWQVGEVVDSWPAVAQIEPRTALVDSPQEHYILLTNPRHARNLTVYAEMRARI